MKNLQYRIGLTPGGPMYRIYEESKYIKGYLHHRCACSCGYTSRWYETAVGYDIDEHYRKHEQELEVLLKEQNAVTNQPGGS